MSDILIAGLFTIGAIIIGAILNWLPNYLKERRDRKDRYFFAMLENRFEVNQQAYNNAEKLKHVIHAEDEKRIKVVNEVQKWFNQNNLYLEPEIRKKFNKTIHDVSFYKNRLEDYKDSRKANGRDTIETKEKRKEMENIFAEIMMGIQEKIQEDVNQYYKYIK